MARAAAAAFAAPGLCSPGRRGGARDVAAGRGRRVEGAGRGKDGRTSVITHADRRKTTYGKVASAAAKLEVPKDIKLKDPKDWKIAGKPLKRLDTADKLNGKKVYAIDVKLPGMLYAAIKEWPVFGSKLVELRRREGQGHAGRTHTWSRSTPRPWRWWPIHGGTRRRRSKRCRSCRRRRQREESSATIAEHLKAGLDRRRSLRSARKATR